MGGRGEGGRTVLCSGRHTDGRPIAASSSVDWRGKSGSSGEILTKSWGSVVVFFVWGRFGWHFKGSAVLCEEEEEKAAEKQEEEKLWG